MPYSDCENKRGGSSILIAIVIIIIIILVVVMIVFGVNHSNTNTNCKQDNFIGCPCGSVFNVCLTCE